MLRRGIALLLVAASALAVAALPPPNAAARTRPCARSEVGQVIVRFIRALNAGNAARLDAVFAKEPSFEWYSTGAPGRRLGGAAYRRATLIPYFVRRHAQRERLTLLSWSGGGNANGYAHFGFRLVRRAKDAPRPLRLDGKGAAICTTSGNTIAVWSM